MNNSLSRGLIVLITAFVISVCFVLFVVWRGQSLNYAEYSMIADPTMRQSAAGLYILRGPGTFIHPSADATVEHSFRYGGTPFALNTVCWTIAVAAVFTTCAIFLGWSFFDITTLGTWSFFEEDVPSSKRLLQSMAAIAPMFLFLAVATHFEAIQNRFFGGKGAAFGLFYQVALCVFIFLHTKLSGNTGLIVLSGSLFLVIKADQKVAVIALAAALLTVMTGIAGNLGATHAAIFVFIALIALLTLVAFALTVEILAALRWYDAGNPVILLSVLGTVILGFGLASIAPALMMFVMYGVIVLTPESMHADFIAVVGVFREGGWEAAAMLAIACMPPLLPSLWFLTRGLATAIARSTPMMARFIQELQNREGALTKAELDQVFKPQKQASTLGFGVASVSILCLSAAVLWLLTNSFTVAG